MDDLLKKRIDLRDSSHLDPAERAELVNSFLFTALGIDNPEEAVKHPLYWDLICWCSQMLALFAMGVQETKLLEVAKAVNGQIMSIHYSLPDGEPELGPGRDEHEAIWYERIEELLKMRGQDE